MACFNANGASKITTTINNKAKAITTKPPLLLLVVFPSPKLDVLKSGTASKIIAIMPITIEIPAGELKKLLRVHQS